MGFYDYAQPPPPRRTRRTRGLGPFVLGCALLVVVLAAVGGLWWLAHARDATSADDSQSPTNLMALNAERLTATAQASGGGVYMATLTPFVSAIQATAPPTVTSNPPAVQPVAQTSAPAPHEAAIVTLTNAARISAGLSPVSIQTQLTAAAQRHSDDMARGDFLNHTGSDGSDAGVRIKATGYMYITAGENILYRWDISADGAFDQWWTSPPHKENIMNPAFTEIGVAYTVADSGKIYYTMVLAAR